MSKIETTEYRCDVCKTKIGDIAQVEKDNQVFINKSVQVIFKTEQTEGRSCNPYLSEDKLDLCKKHRDQLFRGNYIFAHGAQGHNEYFFENNESKELYQYKTELIELGIYGTNPEVEGCSCPRFYKKTAVFNGIGYSCKLHGRQPV